MFSGSEKISGFFCLKIALFEVEGGNLVFFHISYFPRAWFVWYTWKTPHNPEKWEKWEKWEQWGKNGKNGKYDVTIFPIFPIFPFFPIGKMGKTEKWEKWKKWGNFHLWTIELFTIWIDLKTTNLAKRRFCSVVMVFYSTFARHMHWLVPTASPSSSSWI